MATLEAWNRNPELVLRFYNERRKALLSALPNAGHYGLVELEKYFRVRIITQNVDDLHERAGSTNILHLHGELKKSRSTKDPNETAIGSLRKVELIRMKAGEGVAEFRRLLVKG